MSGWAVVQLSVLLLGVAACNGAPPGRSAYRSSKPAVVTPTGPNNIVYGVISSQSTFDKKFLAHVVPWWRNGTRGSVYVDHLTEEQQQRLPPGTPVVTHGELMAPIATSAATKQFGARGVMMFHDLLSRYPAADWFVSADDDTFLVVDNIRAALSNYNASEPWYLGGTPAKYRKRGAWGNFALGGAGIFLSRGALLRMRSTLPGCAARLSKPNAGYVSIGTCVRAHGIPLTIHPGLHQADPWRPALLEHHPVAPLLSLHQVYLNLTGPMKQALALNPAGFAQQSRCIVQLPKEPWLVVSVASGVAVEVWPYGAKGTSPLLLSFPADAADFKEATSPPHTRRATPSGHFAIAASAILADQQHGFTVNTVYQASRDIQDGVNFTRVLVQEPLLPNRWCHAPIQLCCSSWQSTQGPGPGEVTLKLHLTQDGTKCTFKEFTRAVVAKQEQ